MQYHGYLNNRPAHASGENVCGGLFYHYGHTFLQSLSSHWIENFCSLVIPWKATHRSIERFTARLLISIYPITFLRPHNRFNKSNEIPEVQTEISYQRARSSRRCTKSAASIFAQRTSNNRVRRELSNGVIICICCREKQRLYAHECEMSAFSASPQWYYRPPRNAWAGLLFR